MEGTPRHIIPHPQLFILNAVLNDDSEECIENDIRELWCNTVRENSAKMEEVECKGLTWVITYVNPTAAINFLENLMHQAWVPPFDYRPDLSLYRLCYRDGWSLLTHCTYV